MRRLKVKIKENREVSSGFFRMTLESDYLAKTTRPGQFFEIKCPDGAGAFLRRPLGAHRITKDGVEMLYEIVGKGTSSISSMKAGQEADIIGPLGNGFDISKDKGRKPVLVAGGIGVAPLLALAESLAHKRKQNIQVFIGAKTEAHILCDKEFKKLGCDVSVSTEDGSKGQKGFVTETLKKLLLSADGQRQAAIYACGPAGMLKAVSMIAEKHDIPCQVSMEEHMACGVGVCLGCPVKTASGEYKMVCKDGPVFDSKEIAW